jgi:hypothetical protein
MELEQAAPVLDTPAPVEATAPEPTTQAEADTQLGTQTLEQFEQKQPRLRHRARSQQAGPDDVPRIRELTAKNAALAAEVEALKKPAAAPAPVAQTTPSPARPAAGPVPPPVVSADKDPQPTEERDPTTGKPYENFTKFVNDHARWAAREEMRLARSTWETQQRDESAKAEHARLATSWNANVSAAKQQHQDFETVAYGEAPWVQGSLIDRWIQEHPSGALVLYHLKKNPTEAAAMLAMPLFEQTEALSLLSQRVRPQKSAAAVTTGAAPVQDVKPVPRPPTPVRTGPMRTEPATPDPDALSLDDFAEATGYSGRRRH